MGPEREKQEQVETIRVKLAHGLPKDGETGETMEVLVEDDPTKDTYAATVTIEGHTGHGTIRKADGVEAGDAVVEALNDIIKQGFDHGWFVSA